MTCSHPGAMAGLWRCLGAAAAAAALATAPGGVIAATVLAEPQVVAQSYPPPASGVTAEELGSIRIYQANTPSVVNITNLRSVRVASLMGADSENVPVGTGSGFVWDTKGHIVTNFHVIKGASEVKVTLIDQSTYSARVVGADPDKDIAVLQLDMPPAKMAALQPVTLGSSTNLLVGQRVYAIGNPFGLDHTMTSGIISGLGRELNNSIVPIKNVIQTDASINPGNSGGVLLDSQGRLIGINTAIADPTGKGASSGIGFAIPIDTVRGLVDQILTFGKVVRPALGIALAPPQVLQQLGVEGVLVLDVPAGGPAYEAGLQPTYRDRQGNLVLGDVIVSLDGRPVKQVKDLFEALDTKRPGDVVSIELRRGNKTVRTSITLGERVLGQAE